MSGRTSSRVLVGGLAALLLAATGVLAPAQAAPGTAHRRGPVTATGLTAAATVSRRQVGGEPARPHRPRPPGAHRLRTGLGDDQARPRRVGVVRRRRRRAGRDQPGGDRQAPHGCDDARRRRYLALPAGPRGVRGRRACAPRCRRRRSGQRLRTVYGGIAATVPASSVEAVLAIDGVVAVQQDSLAPAAHRLQRGVRQRPARLHRARQHGRRRRGRHLRQPRLRRVAGAPVVRRPGQPRAPRRGPGARGSATSATTR